MNKFFFSLLLVAFISCGEPQPQQESTPTFETRLDSLNHLISENPKNGEALYNRARYYYDTGDFELALNDLNQKMTFDQTDEDFYLKGNIFYSNLQVKNNASNANNAYRLCVEENPQNAKCYVKLAQIQQLLDNYNKCIQLIDSALMIDQQLSDAYFLKGLTFELRKAPGDTTLAISSYQTSIEVDPKFYDAYMRLGDLHAAQNDSIAIQYYTSAISLQPERIEAHYNLGIYLQNSERYDRAMDRYEQILEIDPQSFPAFFNQGYLLLVHASEYEEAAEKFSSAIAANPQYTEAYHNRGLCYKNLGKYQLARADFEKALELNPDLTISAVELSELDQIKN